MTDRAGTSLQRHRRDWEQLAATDPLWAVLTDPSRKGGRWTPEEFLETGEREIAAMLERASALGRPARRDRAFDFGCGGGRLTRALAGRFEEALGVDVAEGMVEVARRLNADVPNCVFAVNDSPDLAAWESRSFDLVYTSLVLQHLPSRRLLEGYLAELLRITKPDGLLVFGVPVRMALLNRLQLSRRLYALLRALRVPDETLLRRTPLTPMRMIWLPERDLLALIARLGADVLDRDEPVGMPGSVRLWVAPAAA
jgi:SAM-dependent methyltransferase